MKSGALLSEAMSEQTHLLGRGDEQQPPPALPAILHRPVLPTLSEAENPTVLPTASGTTPPFGASAPTVIKSKKERKNILVTMEKKGNAAAAIASARRRLFRGNDPLPVPVRSSPESSRSAENVVQRIFGNLRKGIIMTQTENSHAHTMSMIACGIVENSARISKIDALQQERSKRLDEFTAIHRQHREKLDTIFQSLDRTEKRLQGWTAKDQEWKAKNQEWKANLDERIKFHKMVQVNIRQDDEDLAEYDKLFKESGEELRDEDFADLDKLLKESEEEDAEFEKFIAEIDMKLCHSRKTNAEVKEYLKNTVGLQ